MNQPILLTGVTGALGRASAFELARTGRHDLIVAGRSREKLNQLKGELVAAAPKPIAVETVELHLEDKSSTEKAAAAVKALTPSLYGIMSIAAVYKGARSLNADKQEMMFATNHLGPFRLVNALRPLLQKDGRIVIVSAPTTTKLDFGDLQGEKKFSALKAFGASKMCNLLYAFRLAREQKNASVMAFHPGLVKSDILKEAPALLRGFLGLVSSSPAAPAEALRKMMTEPAYANSNGKFLNKKLKEMKAAPYAHDKSAQDKLWEVSERM